jgi:hypothetical protein
MSYMARREAPSGAPRRHVARLARTARRREGPPGAMAAELSGRHIRKWVLWTCARAIEAEAGGAGRRVAAAPGRALGARGSGRGRRHPPRCARMRRRAAPECGRRPQHPGAGRGSRAVAGPAVPPRVTCSGGASPHRCSRVRIKRWRGHGCCACRPRLARRGVGAPMGRTAAALDPE